MALMSSRSQASTARFGTGGKAATRPVAAGVPPLPSSKKGKETARSPHWCARNVVVVGGVSHDRKQPPLPATSFLRSGGWRHADANRRRKALFLDQESPPFLAALLCCALTPDGPT